MTLKLGMVITSATRKLRQEDCKFKVSLGYHSKTMSLKNKQKSDWQDALYHQTTVIYPVTTNDSPHYWLSRRVHNGIPLGEVEASEGPLKMLQ